MQLSETDEPRQVQVGRSKAARQGLGGSNQSGGGGQATNQQPISNKWPHNTVKAPGTHVEKLAEMVFFAVLVGEV